MEAPPCPPPVPTSPRALTSYPVEELLNAVKTTYQKEVGELKSEVSRLRELLELHPHRLHQEHATSPRSNLALNVMTSLDSLAGVTDDSGSPRASRDPKVTLEVATDVKRHVSLGSEAEGKPSVEEEGSVASSRSGDEGYSAAQVLPSHMVVPPLHRQPALPGEVREADAPAEERGSRTLGAADPKDQQLAEKTRSGSDQKPRRRPSCGSAGSAGSSAGLAAHQGVAPKGTPSPNASRSPTAASPANLRSALRNHSLTGTRRGNQGVQRPVFQRPRSMSVSCIEMHRSLSSAGESPGPSPSSWATRLKQKTQQAQGSAKEAKHDGDSDSDSDSESSEKQDESDMQPHSPRSVSRTHSMSQVHPQLLAKYPGLQNRRPSGVSVLSRTESVASKASGSKASRLRSRRPSVSMVSYSTDDKPPTLRGQLGLSPCWLEVSSRAYAEPTLFSPTPKMMALIDEPSNKTTHCAGKSGLRRGKAAMGVRAMTIGKRLSQITQKLVAQPASPKRLVWDLCGVIALMWDLIMIPLNVFEYEVSAPIDAVNKLTSVYWTVDIPASFLVGHHIEGIVEMRPHMIAKRYARTWLAPDVIIVVLDWFLLIGLGNGSVAPGVRSMFRGLRAVRLVRLIKMYSLVEDLTAIFKIRSDAVRTFIGIFKLVLCIMVLNHFIACGFYGLQNFVGPEKRTWVMRNFADQDGMDYRYWTSVHWSMTQFTPASMEVVPVNALERFYTVCVLLLAMITFSSFISSISSAMTRLTLSKQIQREQTSKLFRYMSERHISTEVVNRVWHYLKVRKSQEATNLMESDVTLLAVLPDSLKVDIRTEMYQPVLVTHPFFQTYAELEPGVLRGIAKSAVKEQHMVVNQELFGDSAAVRQMFFVVKGALTYSYPLEENEATSKVEATVSEGQWACEAALWASALELFGPFVASDASDLLLLDAAELRAIVQRYPASQGYACQYADAFMTFASGAAEQCRWRGGLCNDVQEIRPCVDRSLDAHVDLAFEALGSIQLSESETPMHSEDPQGLHQVVPTPSAANMVQDQEQFRKMLFARGRSQTLKADAAVLLGAR